MRTSDFNYYLPEQLIAQTPLEPRDSSRMMVCNRNNSNRADKAFKEIVQYLHPGDVMVINDTKVIPARLIGKKNSSGITVEFLLLKRLEMDMWEVLVRPGRRLHTGDTVSFGDGLLKAEILESTESGGRIVRFVYSGIFEPILEELGQMPLPPYIHEKLLDPERYQTVYAHFDGSAAAPTAGLHFTDGLLKEIKEKGIQIVPVLLHVGLGTFRPVKEEDVEKHIMHSEYYQVSADAAEKINKAKKDGGRLLCIGTTSMRTVETVADDQGKIHAGCGDTDIFIKPGVKIKATDMLLTNFHLPQSTLLMLVSAFMGRDNALDAYRDAVEKKYRFFSFGDCMLIGNDLVSK